MQGILQGKQFRYTVFPPTQEQFYGIKVALFYLVVAQVLHGQGTAFADAPVDTFASDSQWSVSRQSPL